MKGYPTSAFSIPALAVNDSFEFSSPSAKGRGCVKTQNGIDFRNTLPFPIRNKLNTEHSVRSCSIGIITLLCFHTASVVNGQRPPKTGVSYKRFAAASIFLSNPILHKSARPRCGWRPVY